MDGIALHLLGPVADGRIQPRLIVDLDDGAWTTGPHVVLEVGTEMEFTLVELQWLRDRALPAAIAKLAEIQATGGV